MVSDLAADPNAALCVVAACAVAVCAACDFHGGLHLDGATLSENVWIFDLSAVTPHCGFLLAHEGDVGGG